MASPKTRDRSITALSASSLLILSIVKLLIPVASDLLSNKDEKYRALGKRVDKAIKLMRKYDEIDHDPNVDNPGDGMRRKDPDNN